jgi:SsrA-binding protein
LKLSQKIKTQGIAIIPLRMYLVRGKVKLEIAVARGKKLYDKRQAIAEKDAKRNMDRELRNSIKF